MSDPIGAASSTDVRLGQTVLPVERGKVVEFARAVHATSPWFLDPDAGRSAGFQDVVALPTFTVVTAHHEGDGRNANTRAIEWLELDPGKVLLGACSWRYRAPVVAGEILQAESTIDEVDTRTGGRAGSMTRVRVATVFSRRGSGPELARHVSTLLHVPGMFGDDVARSGGAARDRASGDAHATDLGVVTRSGIVRYAGASGDFNPVHHDEEHARSLGLPSVFAMGLYPAGVLAAHLLDEAGATWMRGFDVRFQDRVWPGDRLVVTSTPDGRHVVRADGDELLVAAVELSTHTPGRQS